MPNKEVLNEIHKFPHFVFLAAVLYLSSLICQHAQIKK